MNIENENSEPVTDLRLALGYSSQCTQRKLNNDSGAGANAGSRIDMKFVTSDPLSELVWTSQNGLSLKCTDCSLADKKSSLFLYAGPNNTVLSPSQNIKDNFMVSRGAFYVRSEMGNHGNSIRPPESDATAKAVFTLGRENMADEVAVDFLQNEPSSENPTGGGRGAGQDNQASRMVIVLDSGVHPTKECEANNNVVQMLASPGRGQDGSAPFQRQESKSKMAITIGVHPLERRESTSENDIRTLISENVYGTEKKKIVASESAHGIICSSPHNEEMIAKDKAVSGGNSPTNSRMLMLLKKGKEKALLDVDVNGGMSKEDDDSHESVESCNSTRIFSTGKKQWSFEQQLIVGSKRVKKQAHESPASASHTKQDSSFMNWISNMMRGFSKSSQDEIPPLATLAHPDNGHESPQHKLITCNKNQDSGCRNVGFKSIFQSLYRPNAKLLKRAMDNNYQTEFEPGNRLCDISSPTPIACHGDNNNLCEQFLMSNENFTESTEGNGADPGIQPRINSANYACSSENSEL